MLDGLQVQTVRQGRDLTCPRINMSDNVLQISKICVFFLCDIGSFVMFGMSHVFLPANHLICLLYKLATAICCAWTSEVLEGTRTRNAQPTVNNGGKWNSFHLTVSFADATGTYSTHQGYVSRYFDKIWYHFISLARGVAVDV